MDRRSFVKNTVGTLLAAFGGTVLGGFFLKSIKDPDIKEIAQRSPYSYYVSGPLRPPGAFEEEVFVKKCIQCFLCAEVCPPKAIRFIPAGGGLKANTPYIFPREKGCTLCMKCTEVCPTQALAPLKEDDIYEGKKKVDMGTAEIDTRTCITHLGIGKCEACYTICPVKERAIIQEAMLRPKILPDGCVGCGLCEEICPVKDKSIKVRPPGFHTKEKKDDIFMGPGFFYKG